MATTSTPAELFSSLLSAKQAADARSAESVFLEGLPFRLSIWGGLFAYGMSTGKPWAKWLGGSALAWTGVEYIAARRRSALASSSAVTVGAQQGGATQ